MGPNNHRPDVENIYMGSSFLLCLNVDEIKYESKQNSG